jgi:hypothetical protein
MVSSQVEALSNVQARKRDLLFRLQGFEKRLCCGEDEPERLREQLTFVLSEEKRLLDQGQPRWT